MLDDYEKDSEKNKGEKIVLRPGSSDGRPTLELQRGKNKIKIRYGE